MPERIVTIITTQGAKKASSEFKGLGATVISLNQGFELLNKGIRAISAPIVSLISEGRRFGAQMSAVQAVTKSTGDQFNALREEALRLGETTAFSAVQAGEAMEELGRAGQSTAQIIETTGEALNLAAANGVELADSAQLIAIQMNVFRKEGLKAQKAADLINQTIGSSPQDFEQFRFAMQFAGQAAAAFNRDFEETTQIIGALAESGVAGSKAGTALSTAFARLSKPAAEAQKVLTKYGITLDEINPAANKFADIIDVLNEANLKQSEIISILGLETAPKFFGIIQKGGDAIRDFAEKQKNANTALAAAQTRLNNLEGDVTIFQSALSGLKLAIFESLNNILRESTQATTRLVTAFTTFVKNNRGEIDAIFLAIGNAMQFAREIMQTMIRVLGVLIEAIGELVATQAVINIFENVKTTFSAVIDILKIIGPIFLEIAKVVGGQVVKSFIVFANISSNVAAKSIVFVRDVLETIPRIIETVSNTIDSVINAFKSFGSSANETGTSLMQFLEVHGVIEIFDNLKVSVNAGIEIIKALGRTIFNFISASLNHFIAVMKELGEIFTNVFLIIKTVTEPVFKFLIDQNKEVLKLMLRLIKSGLELLIKQFILVATTITDHVSKAFTTISDAIVFLLDKVDSLVKSFFDLSDSALFKALKSTKNFTKELLKSLTAVEDTDHALTGNSLVPSFQKLSEKLIDAGKRMQEFTFDAKQAKKEIKQLDAEVEKVQAAATGLTVGGTGDTGFLSSIINAFSAGAKAVGGSIKQSFEESGLTFTNILSDISNIFFRLIDSVWSLFTSNEKFKEALDKVFETIGKVLSPVIEAFLPVLETLSRAIEQLAPLFEEIAKELGPVIEELISFTVQLTKAIGPIIKNVIQKLIPLIEKIVDQLGPVLIKLTESLGPVIDNLLDILIPIVEELLPIVVEILDLIAELNPLIAALLELIKPFLPIIRAVIRVVATLVRIIVNILKPIIQILTNVIRLVAGAIQALFNLLEGVFRPILDAIIKLIGGLVSAIKDLIGNLGKIVFGGGGSGGGSGIPFFPFQQGTGALSRDQLVRLPGMEPNAGLVKAHVGESIGRDNQQSMQFVFNIKAIDPKATRAELRQLLEELRATGRL